MKLEADNFRIYKSLTQVIAIIVQSSPAMLPDVDKATPGWNLRHLGVPISTGIVGPRDPLACGVVAPADAASVHLGRGVQDMITPGRLAAAVDAHVEGVRSTGCSIDHLVTQHVVLIALHLAKQLASVLWKYWRQRDGKSFLPACYHLLAIAPSLSSSLSTK